MAQQTYTKASIVLNCAQARTHDPFAARDGSDYDSASSFNSIPTAGQCAPFHAARWNMVGL